MGSVLGGGVPLPSIRCAVDLNYGLLMNERERRSMTTQMMRSYGENSKLARPMELHFTALESAEQYGCLHPHIREWECKRSDKPALETFPRDEVVLLTPDAREPLLELHPEKVYVIAGFIDRSVKKNHVLRVAKNARVAHVRLPLREHAPLSNVHPILDVVSVVQILGRVSNGVSWEEAFKQTIPNRFIIRRLKERHMNIPPPRFP